VRKTDAELNKITMAKMVEIHDPHLYHEVYFGGGHIEKPSEDIRTLYWYMDEAELSKYVKTRGR
jgi:hypothetical protein